MATSKEFHDYVLFDVFQDNKAITSKKMMGEYILYASGVIFGGLHDNRLLIRRDELSDRFFSGSSLVYPYQGSKTLMYVVDIDDETKLRLFADELFKNK